MTYLAYRTAFDPFRGLDRGASYDIVRTGDDAYEFVAAVPGLNQDEITVTALEGALTVKAEPKAKPANDGAVVHRGLYRGGFERRFALAEHVVVKEAELKDGLLTVRLAREVPEAKKPRIIAVNRPATEAALPAAA